MKVNYQDYSNNNVRVSTVLTNAYVAGTVINATNFSNVIPREQNQLLLLIKLTIGNLTTAQVKVEFSPDQGTTWYQETRATVTATASLATSTEVVMEHSYANSGNYRVPVQIKDEWIRVSAVGTGDVTNSLMTISAIVGTA